TPRRGEDGMSLLMESKTPFVARFEELDRLSPKSRWQALRREGRGKFRDTPFPTAKTEDWRFPSVTPLLAEDFALAPVRTVEAGRLPALSHPDALRLVFVNGWFAPALSRLGKVPAGVRVGNLANPGDAAEEVGRHLAHVADTKDHVFTALNQAMLNDG